MIPYALKIQEQSKTIANQTIHRISQRWRRLSAPTHGLQNNSSTMAVGGPVIEVGIPTRPLSEEKLTTSPMLRLGSGTTS